MTTYTANVSHMTFERLRFLMEPFGFTFQSRLFDGGESIRCMTPGRCGISAAAEWGDRFTASGHMMEILLAQGMVPAPIVELLTLTA